MRRMFYAVAVAVSMAPSLDSVSSVPADGTHKDVIVVRGPTLIAFFPSLSEHDARIKADQYEILMIFSITWKRS